MNIPLTYNATFKHAVIQLLLDTRAKLSSICPDTLHWITFRVHPSAPQLGPARYHQDLESFWRKIRPKKCQVVIGPHQKVD